MPTTRQSEIDTAIARHLDTHPTAGYRELARVANCATAQVGPALKRLGLPASGHERAAASGFASGWDRAARLAGNPDA